MKTLKLIAALACVGAFTLSSTAHAQSQVAGTSTTIGVSVTESTQIATGWSVKKTILGKDIYNDHGNKVGKVEDLIISPDRAVSYVIVGAGGFVGIGRHDVAIPMAQIQNQNGKLVMPGATKDIIKSLPAFEYADDTARRDQFVAKAEQDIAKAKARVAELDKRASATANAEAKAKLDKISSAAQADLKMAESKLSELKHASVNRWREFDASVTAAIARLQKSVEKDPS